MPFDIFLKIDSIPGGCTKAGHEGWIEVLSFSHDLSSPADRSTGAAAPCCRDHYVLRDFTVTKKIDQASDRLAVACYKEERIGDVSVELRGAYGRKARVMEYRMTDVVVSDVAPCETAPFDDAEPLERISFHYDKKAWVHSESVIGKDSDGEPGKRVETRSIPPEADMMFREGWIMRDRSVLFCPLIPRRW